MAGETNPFMGKVFVGNPVDIGTLRAKYDAVLMPDEVVEMEFKGIRDGTIFTDRRIAVMNSQGIVGKKVEVSTFPWKSITAFSVENSGTVDLDAELKICGLGWGVCEVQMTKGTKVEAVAAFINNKLFG